MTDPLILLIIAIAVAAIGVSVGSSGLGGFLVPALLVAVLGMSPGAAVVHGLISFLPPGVVATVSYWRRRNRPSWRVAVLLCAGTVPGLLIGRWVAATASQRVLQVLLASLVLAAGVLLSARLRQRRERRPTASPALLTPAAASAGLAGGLSTVLAGVGGPLVTVPVLTLLGLEITPVVGAAMINSVFGVGLGAASLLGSVRLQPVLLLVITGAQLAGVLIGSRLHDRLAGRWLLPVVALAAVATGGWLLVEALTG